MTHHIRTSAQPEGSIGKSARLHYLDWLRVLATLGVFLFNAVHPFDAFDWHIMNAEQSMMATLFIVVLGPWGMPFFYLIAGTGSWFALRRRTGRQYTIERVKRLLIPFIVGSILLSPIQLYFEWSHKTQTGVFAGSLLEFFSSRKISFGPRVFGWAGYHLWFLGFLFAYSLVALPLFLWLRQDGGRRVITWLGGLCEKRGGILVVILPLALIRFILQPLFPNYTGWADFFFMLVFFVYGYILYADQRFVQAVRRDWLLALILGIIATLINFVAGAAGEGIAWSETPGIPGFYLMWSLYSVNSWCWSIFMLYVGMRFLDFSNKRLQYCQEAILPFFLLHQPAIIIIAFFVVQWDVGIMVKLPIVVLSSFVVTLGLYEFLVKRTSPLRSLFGMKPIKRDAGPQSQAGIEHKLFQEVSYE